MATVNSLSDILKKLIFLLISNANLNYTQGIFNGKAKYEVDLRQLGPMVVLAQR